MQPIQSFVDLLCLVPCRGRGRRGLPTPQAWHLHPELGEVEDGDCGGDPPGPGCDGGGGMIIINNMDDLFTRSKPGCGREGGGRRVGADQLLLPGAPAVWLSP